MGLVRRAGRAAAVVAWLAIRVEGVSYVVSSCKEFEAIPTPMLDDTHIVVDQDIFCKSPRSIVVSGPYAYLVSSDLASLTFENLRFSVKDGADFFMSLSSEEYQGTASFIGTEEQRYHGGTFKIDPGASVTFGVPVRFSGSSVAAGKRGGAIYNNGYVTFECSAKFDNSRVTSDPENEALHWGGGGAVYNGELGQAMFRDVTWFTDNTAGAGSAGGGLCNEGVATFLSRTYFTQNAAGENSKSEGGEGGAVYTATGAITTFRRKATFRKNTSGKAGGAIHSAGVTTLQGSGIFYGNEASGREAGSGGHVFSAGVFEVKGDATFRSGRASQYGGALFVSDTGDASFDGKLEFIDNSASRQCHDVYDASSNIVCLSVD